MNRQELQEKLNALLVGNSAYYNYEICAHIEHKLGEWFNDKNGYYSIGCNNYTFTIYYKRRGLVRFDIKRQRNDQYGWICKAVEIESDFTDTDTEIKAIKERLQKENSEEWRWYSFTTLESMTDLLKVIKQACPDKTDGELKRLITELGNYYWNVEENLDE